MFAPSPWSPATATVLLVVVAVGAYYDTSLLSEAIAFLALVAISPSAVVLPVAPVHAVAGYYS